MYGRVYLVRLTRFLLSLWNFSTPIRSFGNVFAVTVGVYSIAITDMEGTYCMYVKCQLRLHSMVLIARVPSKIASNPEIVSWGHLQSNNGENFNMCTVYVCNNYILYSNDIIKFHVKLYWEFDQVHPPVCVQSGRYGWLTILRQGTHGWITSYREGEFQ